MKNKEELKNLKEEVENESRKPHELTEEELEQVTGGFWGLVEIPEDKSGI
ncbi:MAG: bacteriocin [Eubacteriales bacterium]|nr:bacteriocin [Eubacteriales bacterium]